MKATELREKNVNDLHQLLLEQKRKQFKTRLEQGMGEAPNPQSAKSLRREIARIITIINEKERQA